MALQWSTAPEADGEEAALAETDRAGRPVREVGRNAWVRVPSVSGTLVA